MKSGRARTFRLALLAGVVLALGAKAEIVDLIVAEVSQSFPGGPPAAGRVITWSGAYEAARIEAFLNAAAPPDWSLGAPESHQQLRAVVSRMIDQLLLEQALSRSPFTPAVDQNVSERLRQLAARYPTGAEWQQELRRYRLTVPALEARLERESRVMAFVDLTLRPDIRIAPEQVERYYELEFIPRLGGRERGAGPSPGLPPLDDVREQIQEILTQGEINRRLEEWLQQLRRSAKISLRFP